MKRICYYFSYAFFLLSAFSSLHAARPFATDDAGTVQQNNFEIETGAEFGDDYLTGNIAIKHGITRRMDLGFAGAYQRLPKNESRFDPAEFSLKFSLIPELISFSAVSNFGDDTYAATMILSKIFFSVLAIDANMGIEIIGNSNESDLSFGFCCHYEGSRFGAGAEIYGTFDGDKYWLAGVNYGITKWLTIDLAINSDLQNPEIHGIAGLTFCF